jgi:hypothetical protein
VVIIDGVPATQGALHTSGVRRDDRGLGPAPNARYRHADARWHPWCSSSSMANADATQLRTWAAEDEDSDLFPENEMLGDRYIVKQGDSLWRVAAKTLGGGKQWPRIWRYNNRPAVVRVTGRAIPNPDRIYVGQVLLIPRLPSERMNSGDADHQTMAHLDTAAPTTPVAASPPGGSFVPKSPHIVSHPHQRTLGDRAQKLRSPLSFKFRLDMRWPAQDVGTAVLEVRMTGDFVLMTKKAYPATYVTQRREIEHQVTMEANHAFGKLVSDNRFIFDPAKKSLTYRSMLVSQSTTPNAAATAIGVEMSSNSPIPKLRAEIRIPKLEGSYGGFIYTAIDNKFVVEVTPKPERPGSGPTRSPRIVSNPASAPSVDRQWATVLGAGLVVTAGVLVFGALVDEWIPILGQADDVPAFTTAGAMLARGLVLLGATHANLPSAGMPAHVEAKATVSGPSTR